MQSSEGATTRDLGQSREMPEGKADKPTGEDALPSDRLAEADPLLSLLREAMLPPAPVVKGGRSAKAERAEQEKAETEKAKAERSKLKKSRAEKTKLEKAKTEGEQSAKAQLERAEFERAASEEVQFQSAKRECAPQDDLAEAGRRRMEAVGAAILVLICVVGVLFLNRESLFRTAMLRPGDRLMVAPIENLTGDAKLDGGVAQGLEFELRESPGLDISGGEAYRSAVLQLVGSADRPATAVLARQAAAASGAKAYLYGTLRTRGAGYVLSVDVLDAVDNRKMVEVQETASGREQIAGAIERASARLRSALVSDAGVPSGKGEVPLNREATSNLDALREYGVGAAAEADGRADAALAAFQSAVALDPRFAQAQMQLSWLYRQQHEDAASAAAARLAEQAAGGASEHTVLLARSVYEANAMGSLDLAEAALRRFVALYPYDAEGARGLAEVMELRGRTEAPKTAAPH